MTSAFALSFDSGLSKQTKLTWLSLAGNNLTSLDTGVLEKLPQLRYLSVENNAITYLRGLQVTLFTFLSQEPRSLFLTKRFLFVQKKMVVFFVQKTEREMFSKFFQCFVPRLVNKYGKSTGRLAPRSGYRKGSWKGHTKASAKRARSDRHARRGKARFFCAFPRGACLVPHACFALAFACPKNAKKITPVMQARFRLNLVRNSWRFLRQMNLQCRPYCCSS